METTFHEFQHYDFDHDAEFQSGLTRLVTATNSTASDKLDETTLLKFKWYYYCRRFQPFSLEDYLDWVQRQKLPSTATEATTSDDTPKHPLGFAELCQKILAGEPIPGIREIPEQVSQQPPARSQMTPRKKPWETVPTNNP
ncbi:hypothetical protein IWQ62_004887 [Dispira parvispora]|uniref:Uncharacterized protein n=1 Tax=Dispira parvispora TaxID=1520584 RepID=A0A9W8E505_9FUNG|nr:hypothetical protein IWQ62_004887 [Dispira parvispora]